MDTHCGILKGGEFCLKLFSFFINEKYLTRYMGYYTSRDRFIKINGTKYILYACTTKKKYKKDFLKVRRNDIFIIKKKNIDKNEYKELKSAGLNMYELNYYELSNYSYKTKMLLSYFEYECVHTQWIDMILPEEVFSYLSPDIISSINKEYEIALTYLGLNSLILVTGDDSLEYCFDELIFNDDCSVLHVTPNIIPKEKSFSTSFDIKGKEINLFIHIFKSTLKK